MRITSAKAKPMSRKYGPLVRRVMKPNTTLIRAATTPPARKETMNGHSSMVVATPAV
ncbi:hypothetical protein D9M68_881550 [compost metagenome]